MFFDQKFIQHLLRCFDSSNYVLFEHFAIHNPQTEIPFNFLLRKQELLKTIDSIQLFDTIDVASPIHNYNFTKLQIRFDNNSRFQINLWHQLMVGKVNYLDAEQVFSKRQLSKSEFYMPNIEHLFEFAVLWSFLNDVGLPRHYQIYFEDFHFFVRDGLLDFFNEKYSTDFSNLDDLSNFTPTRKEGIVDSLKKLPVNNFFNTSNFKWLNFLSPA